MEIQVFRTSASSYQGSGFITGEQKILEKIPGVKYIKSLKEMNPNLPFILITNTHTDLSEIPEMILKKTLLLIHPNSGYDNINLEFLKENSIPIILGNPIRSHAVAEYILSCIFKEITPIPNHSHWDESRKWDRKLLRDQTALIVGHGHIGKILRQSLIPLTREIRCFDPYENSPGVVNSWSDDLAQDCDLLIMAANSTPYNQQMINEDVFAKLSTNCLIINAARGSLVNEVDLQKFLQKNKKAKCYLDVFTKEPFAPGYLNNLENINKTSHIAGVFQKLNHDIISFEYLVIDDFLKSKSENSQEGFMQDYQECLLTTEHFPSF